MGYWTEHALAHGSPTVVALATAVYKGSSAKTGSTPPRIQGTPLRAWQEENWDKWVGEMDRLMAEAAKYEVGRGGTNEEYEAMMKRLKAVTHATEKLVGAQRGALARVERIEVVWRILAHIGGLVKLTARAQDFPPHPRRIFRGL